MEKEIKELFEKQTQFTAGKLAISEGMTRKTLQRISAVALETPVELQIKEGFESIEGTKYVIFKEKNGNINFKLMEADGSIVLTGSGYPDVSDCLDVIESTRESLKTIAYSHELTAIRKKPDFIQKKAAPIFKSIEEEQTQANRRSNDISFSIHTNGRKHPTFITGRLSDEKVFSAQKAIRALDYLHYTMGFENAEQEFPEEGVEIRRFSDGTFYRMKQYHKGIPVFGQTLILSTDTEGKTETLSGQYAPISCDDEVIISEEQAMASVKKEGGEVLYSDGLFYYVDNKEKAYLCWRIVTEKYTFLISTENGAVVFYSPSEINIDINTNKAITTLLNENADISVLNKNGGKPYSLYDGARNIEIYDDFNTSKAPKAIEVKTLGASDQTVLFEDHAVTAYANIRKVYDYYHNVLGRAGADNKGKKIRIVMNYHELSDQSNALFCSREKNYTKICLSTTGGLERCLDVLGHEFTHSVNNAVWAPIYSNESGSLDEAYADILGEFVQTTKLESLGENSEDGAIRSFRSSRNMYGYRDEIHPNKNNDWGHVHDNSEIISHAAYLIQLGYEKYMTAAESGGELAALFYKSMEYLGSKSGFRDCYYALLYAALKINTGYNMRGKIGAIADAFLHQRIMSDEGKNRRKVTGTVKYATIDEGTPGVTVEAYPVNSSKCETFTITNSKGEYTLQLKDNSKYTLRISRIDGCSGSINTQAISDKNCGPFDFTYKGKFDYSKRVFFISGYVKNPDTGHPIAGATVKLLKGKHTESQVMTMKPDIVLKTDNNGHFFTAALPYGQYDLWAYAHKSTKYCLTKIINLDHTVDPVLNVTLEKKKRFFVTSLSIRSAMTEKEAKDKTKSGYTLLDVDLNKNAGGAWIYLSYMVDNTSKPITNLLVYQSKSKQYWETMEITHNNVKAIYYRLDVDLNKQAGGEYMYLCYTRDTHFSPITRLDVLVKAKNLVREPFWSGVRKVDDFNKSEDNYADLNSGAGGDTIHIMQAKREIME